MCSLLATKHILKLMLRYPLCCIRTQPVQWFPRVDLQGVLRTFISDLQAELQSVCGFQVQMSNKPFYINHELTRPVSEVLHPHVCINIHSNIQVQLIRGLDYSRRDVRIHQWNVT